MDISGQTAEPVGNGNTIATVGVGKDQLVAFGVNVQITRENTGAEFQIVCSGIAVALENGVHPVSRVEDVGVITCGAIKEVVTRASIQNVIAITAQNEIVATLAIKHSSGISTDYRLTGTGTVALGPQAWIAKITERGHNGRHKGRIKSIVGSLGQPASELSVSIPAHAVEVGANNALQVQQVSHRFIGGGIVAGLERGPGIAEVDDKSGLASREADTIEVGLEAGLQQQAVIDRLTQSVIRLIEKTQARVEQVNKDPFRAFGRSTKRSAVETFQGLELGHPGVITGAPFSLTGNHHVGLHPAVSAVAGNGKVRSLAPFDDELIQESKLFRAGGRLGVLADQTGEFRRKAGCFAQVAHSARAAHAWQSLSFRGERDGVGKLAVKGVFKQIDVAHLGADVAHLAAAAVGTYKAAQVGKQVAVGQRLRVFGLGNVDGRDARLIKTLELTFLAHAIAVEVTPYAQIGEVGVACVHHSILVGILLGQSSKAVFGCAYHFALTIHKRGGVAEQLSAIVNRAVTVAVPYQKSVVGLDPAGGGLHPISVVVEEDGVGRIEAHCFQAVAVKVEGQGVAALNGGLGGIEKVANGLLDNVCCSAGIIWRTRQSQFFTWMDQRIASIPRKSAILFKPGVGLD